MGNCPCSYGGLYGLWEQQIMIIQQLVMMVLVNMHHHHLQPQFGCTQVGSLNYDPNANTDDGSCISAVSGCNDPNATNYNAKQM